MPKDSYRYKLKKDKVQFPSSGSFSALDEAEHRQLNDSLKGVVQIFLSEVQPNFVQPWTKSMPNSGTGSGFVVDRKMRLVVTNAHCADNARTILVRKNGDHVKYEAKLLAISHQIDIAILTVHDDAFWVGAEPIEFGEMCHMQQTVDIVGYPIGGDTVSITRGVVSRIDFTPYAQSGGESQLCVQVDAAINPGNSGGPALSNGKLVGVAFQGLSGEEASNVGYIIPVRLLKKLMHHFIECANHQGIKTHGEVRWAGATSSNEPLVILHPFARFAPQYQPAENPFLRQSVGLPEALSGVVIRAVPPVSNLHEALQNNDVLTAIDGVLVGNEGRVMVPPLQPMDFEYLVSLKLVGEPIRYTIYRNGVKMEVSTIAENPPRRIPLISKSPYVPYVMFAGLVFSPFSRDSAISDEPFEDFVVKKEAEFLLAHKSVQYSHAGQQCVVLSALLPHSITIGYQNISPFTPIYKINNTNIDCIADVARAIAACKEGLITFEFCTDECIVLPVKEGLEATSEIQVDYGMASVFSKDVGEVLVAAGLTLDIPEVEIKPAAEESGEGGEGEDEYEDVDIDQEELEKAFEAVLDNFDENGGKPPKQGKKGKGGKWKR